LKRAYYSTISPRPVTQTIALNAARFWRDRPQEVLLAGAVALAGIVAITGSADSTPTLSGVGSDKVAEAPPAPPPMLIRQLPVDQALAINQGIALDTGPNPAARPFSLGKVDTATRSKRGERLRRPGHPKTRSRQPTVALPGPPPMIRPRFNGESIVRWADQ